MKTEQTPKNNCLVDIAYLLSDAAVTFASFSSAFSILNSGAQAQADLVIDGNDLTFATVACAVFMPALYYFQIKGGDSIAPEMAPTPRTFFSNLLETLYSSALLAMLYCESLFLASAAQTYVQSLFDPEQERALVPLNLMLKLLVLSWTLLFDGVFSLATEMLEVGKRLKAAVTHSSANSLMAACLCAFDHAAGKLWLQWGCSSAHTLWYVCNASILVPAQAFIKLKQTDQAALATTATAYAMAMSYLAYFCFWQKVYYEGQAALKNLPSAQTVTSAEVKPLLTVNDMTGSEELATAATNKSSFFKVGLYLQALFRGLCSMATVSVFLRHYLQDHEQNLLISLLAGCCVFAGITAGTLKYDIGKAVKSYQQCSLSRA